MQYNKSSADQACLGQDGWTLTSSFFCLYTDRNFVLVHKYAKKESLYPAIIWSFEHTSPLSFFAFKSKVWKLGTPRNNQLALCTGLRSNTHSKKINKIFFSFNKHVLLMKNKKMLTQVYCRENLIRELREIQGINHYVFRLVL